jgi:hypothetical protein
MVPLDQYEKWHPCLDERARQFLSEEEYREYQAIPASERLLQIQAILERPIARFSQVNDVFFRARWAEVLASLETSTPLTLLEIASGDADSIPQMMARAYPHSHYISANMNRILTDGLRQKTRHLPLEVRIIEEDAVEINRHLPAESVDIIAFQHAVNDVIQAILCQREGVDTVDADWMDTLPKMIRILQQELSQDTFEQHARPAFLSLLTNLSQVLKANGWIVMNHYMFQLDLDWGYPPGLWEDLIPITREWLRALPGFKEVFLEGFDPHWWIFYRKQEAI